MKPVQHALNRGADRPWGQGRAVHHHDRQAQFSRRHELRLGALATCILGHDDLRAMVAHQGKVILVAEWPAAQYHPGIGQRQRLTGRIDQAQEVMMLRRRGEVAKALAADGKENTGRLHGQGCGSLLSALHRDPVLTRPGHPGGALQSHQGNSREFSGFHRVLRHLRREGMRGIDHMCDALVVQEGHQSLNAAKSPNALGQGLADRGLGAPGIGIDACHPRLGQGAGQVSCFGGAAQKKDARHV